MLTFFRNQNLSKLWTDRKPGGEFNGRERNVNKIKQNTNIYLHFCSIGPRSIKK